MPIEGQCKISFAVNDEAIITNWDVQGDWIGCDDKASSLRKKLRDSF